MHKKRLATLDVSSLALGCMGMTNFYGHVNRNDCIKTIATAIEHDITFFDTADSYGLGENEILLGNAIQPFRNQVTIATKVGVVREKDQVSINGKPEYIKNQCIKSLEQLKISIIDLYYLHHLDPHTPIEESIDAMSQLVKEGKVRYIGLGEMDEDTIRRAHKIHPITAIQAEFSLFYEEAKERFLPVCEELGITFIACAPLCRGLLTNTIKSFGDLKSEDFRKYLPRFSEENISHNIKIVSLLQKIADNKKCTISQLCLAYVAHHPSIIPLFGTTKEHHLIENIKCHISLTDGDIINIKNILATNAIHGDRLPMSAKKFYPPK